MIKIQKGIRAPSRNLGASLVIRKMKAGDSVLFKDEREALSFVSKACHLSIKVRRKAGPKGIRVWRLA